MFFVLQTANVTADAKNCVYPNRKELKDAVRFDHVCGVFKKDYRNISNFLKSNVIVMDCDNDHSDDPAEWITFEKLETRFDEVSYAAAPSRNHMKEKDGRVARPKFHVYFPIEETEDAEHYATVKRAIQKAYPFFDDNALDAARFIFGSDPDEVVWHEGWVTIDEEVDPEPEDEEPETRSSYTGGAIMKGTRNKTLSHFAGRALKRFGETENGKPVLVAYWYQYDAERIKSRFDVREIKTPKDIADWNNGEIPVAIIHPASAGHGLNLQTGGSTLIWFGLTWSLELYQQTNARLHRQGQYFGISGRYGRLLN